MVRSRNVWLVAALALGLGASACKKNEDKAAPANTGGIAGAAKAAAGAAGAAVGAASDDLSLLPADSHIVLGLNFAQLQQSALWKQYIPALMAQGSKGLAEFQATCGFDPMQALQSASMGLKMNGEEDAEGVVVLHGPDKAKVMACLPKFKDQLAKDGGDLVVDGDVFTMKAGPDAASVWTFVNGTTMVGTIGKAASKATLEAATKGGSALKTSQAFKDIYAKIDTKQSLWLLINGNAPFMAKATQAGFEAKAMFGSINVTDGLSLDMQMRLGTAEKATELVAMAQGQIGSPQVKAMFDKLEVTASGTDAKVSVALSGEKLKALVGMFGGMLGGLVGGAGGLGGGIGGP